MKEHKLFLTTSVFFIILFSGLTITHAQIFIGSTEVDTHSVVTGLDTPWEILWGPDNHIWLTERPGRVSRLNPETGQMDLLLTIPDVHEQSESGLLGMALHPDFPDTSYLYLVYNYFSGNIRERIVRYSFTGNSLQNPFILLDNIAGSGIHNGSRIVIDDNYKLYVTTGDASSQPTAQNLSSLNGKILRMNLDGSIPDDNPISASYLWSWGHRNPQGLVIASDGKMYSSEHGPNTDDELNLIIKGGNYGWPDVHGFCNTASEITFCNANSVIEPLYAWTPTLAVAGIAYYNSDAIPHWKHSILMTTLKEREMVSLSLSTDGNSVISVATWFDNWFGRLRDICTDPDGNIYIAVSNRDGRGSPVSADDRIVQVKAKNLTSIKNGKELPMHFKVFPNPFTERATIQLNNEIKTAKIVIYDYSGKTIMADTFSGKEYMLDRKNLKPGFYLVEIVSETSIGRTSIIVSE